MRDCANLALFRGRSAGEPAFKDGGTPLAATGDTPTTKLHVLYFRTSRIANLGTKFHNGVRPDLKVEVRDNNARPSLELDGRKLQLTYELASGDSVPEWRKSATVNGTQAVFESLDLKHGNGKHRMRYGQDQPTRLVIWALDANGSINPAVAGIRSADLFAVSNQTYRSTSLRDLAAKSLPMKAISGLVHAHEKLVARGEYLQGCVFVDTLLQRMKDEGMFRDEGSGVVVEKLNKIIVIEELTVDEKVFPAFELVKWATNNPTLIEFTNTYRRFYRKYFEPTFEDFGVYDKKKYYVKWAQEVLDQLKKSHIITTDLQGTEISPQIFYDQTVHTQFQFNDDLKFIGSPEHPIVGGKEKLHAEPRQSTMEEDATNDTGTSSSSRYGHCPSSILH